MRLFLEEIGTTPNSTASQLFVNNKPFCFVIEDGYKDIKVWGETRIPPGSYQIVKHKSGKFFEQYSRSFGHKWVPMLKDVPGFEWILIHIGNWVRDTAGCLLVNRGINISTKGDYYGTDSTSVYKLLYSLIDKAFKDGEEVWIDIQRRTIIGEDVVG